MRDSLNATLRIWREIVRFSESQIRRRISARTPLGEAQFVALIIHAITARFGAIISATRDNGDDLVLQITVNSARPEQYCV